MTPQRFNRLLFLSLAVPTVLIAVMASVMAFEVSQLRRALGWVDHTDAVIAEGRVALRRIVDAETGLRGYLITGNEAFLAPWRRANAIPDEFSKLEAMVGDNPLQQQLLKANEEQFLTWLDYSKEMVRRRQTNGDYAAFEPNYQGKLLMDDIHQGFSNFTDAEQKLRDARVQRANALDTDFKWSLGILSVALAATLVLFSRYQLRTLARQYDSALQIAQESAEQERESKNWFHTLLRSVGDAVIATDALGHISFINPAAEAATGWTEADARAQPLEKVFHIVNADSRHEVENPVDKVRRLNNVVGLANHTLLIRRDGSEINIDDSGAPIRDEQGRVLGIILIFRDITKQYQMERTLRATERLALAGRITASVAHEIHNPLDTVNNLLYLIQSDNRHLHTSEYAALAIQEIERINQVTRSMLSLYRESQAPVTVALSEVIESVLTLLDLQIRNKEAQIACNVPHHAKVEGFPAELRQVFTNLIHNALDAIPQFGKITINCDSAETEQSVRITVTDNGGGLSTANLSHLFQPLFTTKGVNGTGLGLWVSKGIVEKHGGSIEVCANVGQGTTGASFTVILPRLFPAEASSLGEAAA